jgi:hypothetical protein
LIRAGIEQLQGLWHHSVQTVHPGTIQLDGDTAVGRSYMAEFGRLRDGSSHLNHAVYHDGYRRMSEGWKFTERVYEVGYLDTTPPAGSPSDDAFAARLSGAGEVEWILQLGYEAAADRIYGTAVAPGGGLYVTGYSSGSLDGTANAGDKGAFVARISATGDLVWTHQFGGSGEDKGQAVTVGSSGEVYVAGVTSGTMPGGTNQGGLDGWVARFTPDGHPCLPGRADLKGSRPEGTPRLTWRRRPPVPITESAYLQGR